MSNVQAAKVINEHGVDILVDLVGFMKGQTDGYPALRPAPVQVRWLGMAGTSGADFFDYIITDRTVTPENQARYYTEKFIYLPQCYQINDNQPYVDENDCQKSDFGLPERLSFTVASIPAIKLIREIFSDLDEYTQTPARQCSLVDGELIETRRKSKNVAIENGIDSDRLIFAEKLSKHKHLSRLSLADLVLDTLRVNGAASTSDALWSGVPVLTIQGKHFASRMSSSILKAAGVPELITHSLEDYENKAVELAEEKSKLARIKR